MWVKRDVVMLPTNKSNMCRIIDLEDNTFKFNIQPNQDAFIDTVDKGFHVEPFHLYILSDEEIKEGDWFIWLKYNTIHKATKSDDNKECKKIIATTDKSLTINGYDTSDEEAIVKCFLHQISQLFIEYFISEYNKGNIITEVMVEYYDSREPFMPSEWNQLKINSDNTINIKPIKDSWSRDEVKQLFINFTMTDLYSLPLNRNDRKEYINTWIEENI